MACSPRGRVRWVIGAGSVLAGALLFAADTQAQTSPITFLHKFHAGPRTPSGRLVETADGSLYGTTACGGEPDLSCDGGTIFTLRPRTDGTWAYEDLHHFRPGLHGSNPSSGLTLARDGSLYGIATRRGLPQGAASGGTIFRLSTTGSLAPVYVFTDWDGLPNTESPIGRLTEAADGDFYGSACDQGGTGPKSRIFRVSPSGAFQTVYIYPRSTTEPVQAPNGMCPVTQFHEATDGFMYGTTVMGGPSISPFFPPQGTLFRIDPRAASPSAIVLHTFRGFDGAVPTGGLAAGPAGELFGTTAAGGWLGQGVVFHRDASGTVRTLHTFRGSDGATPFGGLFRTPEGAMYGTTLGGGSGHGTVFRAGASGGITPLHAFNGDDGSVPVEVMRARDGNLYGVTARGGPGGGGTVYRISPGGAASTVHAFSGGARYPQWGVIQASDGNFYGTTEGGRSDAGTVFRLTPAGVLTILHEFAPAPAFHPSVGASGLIEGADGFLYGRTQCGGANERGTIYRISTDGAFTVLHHFAASPHRCGSLVEGLIQASDGNFYGLTRADSAEAATLFKMEPSGIFTALYTFTEPAANAPFGPLAEGPDGALYGVAYNVSSPVIGSLFKVTTSGTFTLLYEFGNSPAGTSPVGGLIRSARGGFYGVTRLTQPSVYYFDPATNAVTPVAPLTLANDGAVLEARDGALYGWLLVPAPGGTSRIRFFRVADGALEFFYDGADEDGDRVSRLIEGADGALYGTMAEGLSRPFAPETWPADAFAGGVFRLAIPPRK